MRTIVLAALITAVALFRVPSASASSPDAELKLALGGAHRVEAAAAALQAQASSRLTDPSPGPVAQLIGPVAVTEASLEYFIAAAGKLLAGDAAAQLAVLQDRLAELKSQKGMLQALLGSKDAYPDLVVSIAATASQTIEQTTSIERVLNCFASLDC